MEYRTFHRPLHPRASASGCVPVHILVCEKALGHYLPDGAHVHHVDGNPRNNANTNLVICEDATYHKLLHWRESIVKAGGDPNTQKRCSFCGELKLFAEFDLRRAHTSTGRQNACRPCMRARNKGRDRQGLTA